MCCGYRALKALGTTMQKWRTERLEIKSEAPSQFLLNRIEPLHKEVQVHS